MQSVTILIGHSVACLCASTCNAMQFRHAVSGFSADRAGAPIAILVESAEDFPDGGSCDVSPLGLLRLQFQRGSCYKPCLVLVGSVLWALFCVWHIRGV